MIVARKKKRFRPGPTAPAAEIVTPAAADGESMATPALAPDDPDAVESPTLAPALPADSEAATPTDTESSGQALESAAGPTPTVGSPPAEPDGHAPPETLLELDDVVPTPSSSGPAGGGHPDEAMGTELLHHGRAAEPTDNPVVTEALSVEPAPESTGDPVVSEVLSVEQPPESTDDPVGTELRLVEHAPESTDDHVVTEARPVDHAPESTRAEWVEDGDSTEPLSAGEPDGEPFSSEGADESSPAAALPVEDAPEPTSAAAGDEVFTTRPDAEPLTDEDEAVQGPATALATPVVPAPDGVEDHAVASTDYTPEPVRGSVGKPVQGAAAWRRLMRMGLPRATKANLLAGLLAVLLGLAIATQVQLTQQRGLSQLSQTDLIRVLDDVSLRSSRLDAQIRELEATRDRLRSGTGSSAEALEQAQKRVDTLGILAGTVAATGPGVIITLEDPDNALTGPIVLDLIQELRDAGAEAIDVGGVRVVASSFVAEVDGDIAIDGVPVTRPIVIKAIGDAKTLSSAMTIPGGIVETVRQKQASAKVAERETIEITSLHTAEDLKNARVVE